MGAAVFFCCSREVGPAGAGNGALPDDFTSRLDRRRKKLILEIAVRQTGAFDEFDNPLRLGDIPGKRFLASHAFQRCAAMRDGLEDLLKIFEPGMIRPANPNRLDCGIGDHLADRAVEFGFSDFQGMRKIRRFRSIVCVGTPDASDIGVADADERFQVKAGVEAAADDADS